MSEAKGHWRDPLDGHGLAYFEELTVEYRTILRPDPVGDKAAVEAALKEKAAKDADIAHQKAKAEADTAASKAAAASPPDPDLDKDAEAKAKAAAAATTTLAAANKEAAQAQAKVDAQTAAAIIIVELINKKDRGKAIWSDILIFESALARLLPFELLKARLISLRQEYREAMGATAALPMEATYLDLKSVTEDKDLLRVQAEATNLMTELHWTLVTAPVRESQKTWLSIKLGGYALLAGLFILLTCLRTAPSSEANCWLRIKEVVWSLHIRCSTLQFVMLAGAAGATLSAFQRIQKGAASGSELLNLRKSLLGSLSVGVAPAIGALSALLLTLMFAGGIISGNFFPKVTLHADDGGTNHLATVTTQGRTSTITNNLPSYTNTVSVTNPPTITNLVNITNTALLTNLVHLTNTLVWTNLPAVTSDVATWRDCKTICQHRWCVAAGADLALLLIWAFIAGFSERLVPDMLTRLAKKAEEKV